MNHKPDQLILVWTGDADDNGRPLFEVREDYTVELYPGAEITVPAGYVSNLGTIPRIAYRLVTPAEIGAEAVVHDWMANEYFGKGPRPPGHFSRWLADAVLKEMLSRNRNVPKWRAWMVFGAVRYWARKKGIK